MQLMYCDNQSAIKLSKIPVYHKQSKHISFHFTRELVDKKIITVQYLYTESIIANILIKLLNKVKYLQCVRLPQLE